MVARPLPVLGAGVGVVLLSRVATRRELGAGQLLAGEIGLQAALHLLFCLPFVGRPMSGPAMTAAAARPDWRMGLPWHDGPRMLGLHLLAAALMALLLRRGERALTGLLRLLLLLARTAGRWPVELAPAARRLAGPAPAVVATPRVAARLLMLSAAVARRGPPAGSCPA